MTEFQDDTFITMEFMGCQVHAIGKAIRPLLTDPATYSNLQYSKLGATIDISINTPEDVLFGFAVLKIPPSSSSSSNKLLTSFFFVTDGEPCTRNMKVQHDYQGVANITILWELNKILCTLHLYTLKMYVVS